VNQEEDWRNRKQWDAYKEATNEMVAHASTEFAPRTGISRPASPRKKPTPKPKGSSRAVSKEAQGARAESSSAASSHPYRVD
jgi:hypothetical protein